MHREIGARLSSSIDVVSQSAATGFEGIPQRAAQGYDQAFAAFMGQARRRCGGVDFGAE